MTIAFLTSSDPFDKKFWSGIPAYLYLAIEKRGYKVISLGPVEYSKNQLRIIKVFSRLHSIIFYKKKYNPFHNSLKAYFAAGFFSKKIKQNKIDLIFAPVAAPEIAFLKTDLPIIYLSDSSFNQVLEYYSYSFWTNLSTFSIKESNYIERKALKKSSYIIYPSNWAAEYATNFYKLDSKKIKIIGFGANIETPKFLINNKAYNSTVTFLFLGVDWIRKGGEIALEVIESLSVKGFDVKLIVCGCVPPVQNKLMEVIPFLDKNKFDDNLKIQELLLNSHFLFLPTRAECLGIVFCEAAAYGLPVITTDTGGVTAVVKNGINGYALPLDASIEDYVTTIENLLHEPAQIATMAKSARLKYEQELNWDVFGEKFEELVKCLV